MNSGEWLRYPVYVIASLDVVAFLIMTVAPLFVHFIRQEEVMVTRCPNGALFDEAGICNCGAGHEDPDLLSLPAVGNSGAQPICGFCEQPMHQGDHRQCLEEALAAGKPT